MLLVVEDNKIVLEAYQALFKGFNFEYCLARNGSEALKLYKEREIDLILLDILLEEIDGYQICNKIREVEREEGRKQVPIIAVSSDSIDKEKLKSYEINGAIRKPLTLGKLKELLKSFNL